MRRLHRSPFEINAVFPTSALQHVPAKLSAVISVYPLHHTPAWPAGREAKPGQPLLLRQNRVSDAQTNRHAVGRLQRDVNTHHHPTEHINGQRYPRAANTKAVNVVDQHDGELCMINLDHRERPVGPREMAGEGVVLFAGNLGPQPLFVLFLFGDGQDPIANGVVVRRFEFRVGEAPSDLVSRLLDGTLLSVQVNLFEQTADDCICLRRQPTASFTTTVLCRCEF